jgi:hypothetical protein
LLNYPREVVRVLLKDRFETPRTETMYLHAMTEQRPGFHRNDRRFVRPLFRELSLPVDELIKTRHVVWTEAGEEDEVMRPNQNVHTVDLEETDLPDGSCDAGYAGGARQPGTIKSLSGQGDAACFG